MADKPAAHVIRSWVRLMKAQHLVFASIERALKAAGLPPLVWYDVLLEVERAGAPGIRPFALERAMLLAQYNLSRLLDRIEGDGYIERRACADDGRGRVVHITESGKSVRRKMWPVYARAIEASVGQHLNIREVTCLDDILGKLIEKVGDT
jgi:DNA-binding MarR family transcriptional regulator